MSRGVGHWKGRSCSPGGGPGKQHLLQSRTYFPLKRGLQTAISEKTQTIMKLKIEPHKEGLVKNRKTKA